MGIEVVVLLSLSTITQIAMLSFGILGNLFIKFMAMIPTYTIEYLIVRQVLLA